MTWEVIPNVIKAITGKPNWLTGPRIALENAADRRGDTFSGQITSSVAQGTAPLVVTSTTKVVNLNVDKVDGYDFDQALLTTSSPTFGGLTSSGPVSISYGLNADYILKIQNPGSTGGGLQIKAASANDPTAILLNIQDNSAAETYFKVQSNGIVSTKNTIIDNGTSSVADGDAIQKAGNYKVASTWVGSPYSGSNGGNQGYLEHHQWGDYTNPYAYQVHTEVNGSKKRRYRIKDNGVWNSWVESISSAGGTIYGTMTFNGAVFTRDNHVQIYKNNAPIDDVSYSNGNLELYTTDGSHPILGFHRGGSSSMSLFHDGSSETVPLKIRSGRASSYAVTIATVGDTNYYVRPDGNDSNDGLSDSPTGAFKTITKAVSKLPSHINHNMNIYVSDGNYGENVRIVGYDGAGQVQLYGNVTAFNVLTNTIYVSNCKCNIIIQGFRTLSPNSNNLVISNCSYAYVYKIQSIAPQSQGISNIFVEAGSNAYINACELTGKDYGILAHLSLVCSVNNTGTGNGYGLFATNGAAITKTGTQPGGTNAEFSSNGGLVRS